MDEFLWKKKKKKGLQVEFHFLDFEKKICNTKKL